MPPAKKGGKNKAGAGPGLPIRQTFPQNSTPLVPLPEYDDAVVAKEQWEMKKKGLLFEDPDGSIFAIHHFCCYSCGAFPFRVLSTSTRPKSLFFFVFALLNGPSLERASSVASGSAGTSGRRRDLETPV